MSAVDYCKAFTPSAGEGSGSKPGTRVRVDSVDVVRGLVMVLMALDHVGSFLGPRVDPEDLETAGTALFLNRWVTHFCAPAFVFLGGAGAYLRGTQTRSRGALAWFLMTRGVFLVVLELTLVHWLWSFSVDYRFAVGQVIFAMGAGMVALSALVFLPHWVVGVIGITVLVAHNLGDGLRSGELGPAGLLWDLLHTRRGFEWSPGRQFFLVYPLLPWFGILTAGYGFGGLLIGDSNSRQRRLLILGSALCMAFVILRTTGLYGDPHPWSRQPDTSRTVLTFLSPEMYPPSLQFTLMTLGPAVCALALVDRLPEAVTHPLRVFGQVPLFYYLLHFLVIHALAVAICLARYGRADWLFGSLPPPPRDGFGFGLPVIYAIWVLVVAALYPACLWFGKIKRRHPGGFLSYL